MDQGLPQMECTPEQYEMLQNYINTNKSKQQEEDIRRQEQIIDMNHKFWNTQPVPRLNDKMIDGVIKEMDSDEVSEEPYKLPKEFKWSTVDLRDKDTCAEVSEFLNKYYSNKDFRPDFSTNFLEWLLPVNLDASTTSKYNPNFCVAVRVTDTDLLAGFIAGKVVKMQVNRHQLDMGEVSVLCIHPKLRGKRLTTMLIKELTRRYQSEGYIFASYSTGRHLAKPLCKVKNYHRALNIKVLLDTGFTKVDDNVGLKKLKHAYKLPEAPSHEDKFVKLEEQHLEEACDTLNRYMDRYTYHPIFDLEEFKHTFYGNKVVSSYVVLDDDGHVTDFTSYYLQPARVYNSTKDKHEFIRVGYMFYYTSLVETPYRMVKDTLIMARRNNVDVMDASDIMENEDLLKELMFEEGAIRSYYYLYNRHYSSMNNNQVCKVFVL